MRSILATLGIGVVLVCGCDDAKEGKPPDPNVSRPIQIDADKPDLDGNAPQPPNNADTATSPGQNTPTSKPATQPAAP